MRYFTSLILLLAATSTMYAGETREKLKVDNSTREMLVYVPDKLPEYAPLVISMHGMNQDAEYQKGMAHWAEVADTAGFVVVYPEGEGKSWDIGGDKDTKFVEAIIENMFERYHINKNRVYLSGFSMGGMFTYHAASIIADKIAAFAPISGYNMGGSAPHTRPVPIIHTHGTDDDVVAYSGARPYVLKWVDIDGCNKTSVYTKPYHGKSNASLEVWTNQETGMEVALLTLDGKGHWVSMDASCVLTSCEIWNFCKRYSLDGPIAAVPPKLLKAMPADGSFDLPNEGLCFSYTFNKPIVAENLYAKLIGPSSQFTLRPTGSQPDETVTFVMNPEDSLDSGEYSMTLYNVVDTFGGVKKDCFFKYYIGQEEVTGEFVADTLYREDWISRRELDDDCIPTSWIRTEIYSGRREVTRQNEYCSSGSRLRYFKSGGDMDAAIYLIASGTGSTTMTYGNYSDAVLHLTKGRYAVEFSSAYWNAPAMNNEVTFSMTVCNPAGIAVCNEENLVSAGHANGDVNRSISGSKTHRVEFSVSNEGDYTLNFIATSNKFAVLVGNVIVSTTPTMAQKYKGPLVAALKKLNNVFDYLSAEYPEYTLTYRQNLKSEIDRYSSLSGTTPEEFVKATGEVLKLVEEAETHAANLVMFLEAMADAQYLLELFAGDEEVSQGRYYVKLQRTVEQYGGDFLETASTFQLWNAADEIAACAEKLRSKTEVRTPVDDSVVSEEFIGLDGRVVENPTSGVYISRKVFGDGRVTVTKRIF